jgi:hypothetical protein
MKRLAAVGAAGVARALSGPVVGTGAGAAPAGKLAEKRGRTVKAPSGSKKVSVRSGTGAASFWPGCIDQITWRLGALMMPIRANIVGPPRAATSTEICELFLVGAQLGQDPVLVGDLDDVGGVDAFPRDRRRFHF